MYSVFMETQNVIDIDWREKLRLEFVGNGMGSMLDVAAKRINELETALKEAEEIARQAIAIYEQGK